MSSETNIQKEFTESSYRYFIKLAKQNFRFRYFSDLPLGSGEILWRHDVDVSPHRARAIARIESDLQVGSTFLFRIRSADYSILDREVREIITEILGLGHEVGLHFEIEENEQSQAEILLSLGRDKKLFELITGIQPKVFSFHNPTPLMFEMTDPEYLGMANAYSDQYFDVKNGQYVSDSNGYWRFQSLGEVLANSKSEKLQVLTHPEWWTPESLKPRDRIWRAHIGRAENAHKRYIELLETLGRTDLGK